MSPISPSEDERAPRVRRPRRSRILAGTVAASLAFAGLAVVNSQNASAATDPAAPNAQAVGNFVDATIGGKPLDQLVKLKYATAQAPGSTSVQNPLDVELLSAIDLPLTGVLQLPSLLGIHLGAVTQKAYANVDGQSYGQSGLLLNQGGVSIGGDNNAADMAGNATIDLTGSGIAGSAGSAADALGGVTVNVGGISADAVSTKFDADGNSSVSTDYQIANLTITAGSPLLAQLTSSLAGLTSTLTKVAGSAAGAAAPAGCDLSAVGVPNSISLEGGAIVLSLAKASITIDLGALLKQLNLDLNNMAPNTDLIGYLLNYLTDPNGLAAGVTNLINGITDPLAACGKAFLNNIPVLGPVLGQVIDALTQGQKTLETTVSGLLGQLASAAGTNPLAPLATALEGLIDIGVNVQPNGPAGPSGFAYTDHLAATAKQGTPVVPGQTVVRAVEINLLTGASGSAASGNSGLLTLALGNAAAGPSTPSAAPTSVAPSSHGVSPVATSSKVPSKLPTGINAGLGTHGGAPVAPIVLLIVGLMLAGGGAAAWRFRGASGSHTG
jgi:hypothetical protein